MSWRLKSCNRCLGDLFHEDDEWHCMQCGHYYYPNDPGLAIVLSEISLTSSRNGSGRQRTGRFGGKNVNSALGAEVRSDQRWWSRNQEIISYLSQGRSVQEVATLTGKGQRQVRAARERLAIIGQSPIEMAEAAVAA